MPACSTRRRARSRSPTTRATRSSSTRPPTPGSTARCWPTAGRPRRSPRYYARADRARSRCRDHHRRRSGHRSAPRSRRPASRSTAGAPSAPRTAPTEDYGYAASLILARAIGERVGDDGLQAVWADAAAGPGRTSRAAAGGAPTAPETVDGPPDWRGLLDLLDEHATTSLDDLWRTWVARPDDLAAARRPRRPPVRATRRSLAAPGSGSCRGAPRCDACVAVR